MAISIPLLPPIYGHVEVEANGKRMYKNVQTGKIIDPVEIYNTTYLTHEEINALVVAKIREKYDINEEFKMINLGITDFTNEHYVAYREYVQECVDWGNNLEVSLEKEQ